MSSHQCVGTVSLMMLFVDNTFSFQYCINEARLLRFCGRELFIPQNDDFFSGYVSLSDTQQYGVLGGGFKHFLCSPLFGEDEPILTNIVQMG